MTVKDDTTPNPEAELDALMSGGNPDMDAQDDGADKDRKPAAKDGEDDDDDKGGKEKTEDKPRRERGERSRGADRPGKRDRGMERVFQGLSAVSEQLKALPTLAERIAALESGTTEAQRAAADPKPKLDECDSTEDYEEKLDKWHERNPKVAAKEPEKKEPPKKAEPEPNTFSNEQIAEALGVDLEQLEDFLDAVEDVKEKFEDYDEVMGKLKDLPPATLMKSLLITEFDNGAETIYWLVKNAPKEYKRIAGLTRSRDVSRALEAVEAKMAENAESPESEDSPELDEPVFKPVGGAKAPRSGAGKDKDESTMPADEFFAQEEKKRRGG